MPIPSQWRVASARGRSGHVGGWCHRHGLHGLCSVPASRPATPHLRCGFTCVLSMRISAGGPPAAASASNTAGQTPFSEHAQADLQRLVRTIGARHGLPAASRLQHLDDAADHPRVVDHGAPLRLPGSSGRSRPTARRSARTPPANHPPHQRQEFLAPQESHLWVPALARDQSSSCIRPTYLPKRSAAAIDRNVAQARARVAATWLVVTLHAAPPWGGLTDARSRGPHLRALLITVDD